jgi:hypothetical protein
VHMLRFDLVVRTPLHLLPIRWHAVNLPWRSEVDSWRSTRATSDLWALFPARFADAYRESLIWSGTFEAPCCDGAARTCRPTDPTDAPLSDPHSRVPHL